MKILYLCHIVPTPDGTGDLRHYQFLRELAKKHTVRILVGAHNICWSSDDVRRLGAVVEDIQILELARPHKPMVARAANSFLRSVLPGIKPWWHDREFERAVAEAIKTFRPDVIHANVPTAKHCSRIRDVPMVVDFCDAMSLHSRVFGGRLRAWWWRRGHRKLERFIASFADQVIVISDRDAKAVNCPSKKTAVVPNGVDLEYFKPNAEPYNERMLCFVGAMDYLPNIDAARYLAYDIWPLIQRVLPGTRVYLVGRNPAPSVWNLNSHQGIEVTGTVDDIRPYVWKSVATIAPIRFASGLQNKVIQSLAMGVPVVLTPAANGGIGATEEDGVITALQPEEYAEAVACLIRDQEYRNMLGLAGRRYVERNFTWEGALRMLEDAYHKATGGMDEQ